MTFTKIAASVVLAAVVTALAVPADAATKRKRSTITYAASDPNYYRPATRLTVRKRSFLSGGTETLQWDSHDHDYAYPPGYTPYMDKNDPKVSFNRMGLPDPWDIPGWPKY